MLFPKSKILKWLNRNKRYFGVAAFAYGLYHTIAYLIEYPLDLVVDDFFDVGLLSFFTLGFYKLSLATSLSTCYACNISTRIDNVFFINRIQNRV